MPFISDIVLNILCFVWVRSKFCCLVFRMMPLRALIGKTFIYVSLVQCTFCVAIISPASTCIYTGKTNRPRDEADTDIYHSPTDIATNCRSRNLLK